MGVDEWIERYRVAWEQRDPEAAAELFTADAVYWSSPFGEPHRGRDGIHEYWARATGSQSDVQVRIGRPIVDANRAAVEWWTTMRDRGAEITLPGILFLRFAPEGRCQELREAWMVAEGQLEPHPGWGG
ncbi:MAG TPA: nuclear transport factor 2 family protein [Gaiellaceae bacterium]